MQPDALGAVVTVVIVDREGVTAELLEARRYVQGDINARACGRTHETTTARAVVTGSVCLHDPLMLES